MVECPQQLRERYREGRVLPFIGAGASMAVIWNEAGEERRGPSWRELVDEAAHQLGWSKPELLRVRGNDLQILEWFRIRHHDKTEKLSNWLVRGLHPPEEALKNSLIHRRLSELDKCHLFYTTNFDDFLERSFELFARNVKPIAIEAEMAEPGPDTEVIKFHGDLNHIDELVLSERDYERRLTLSTAMDYRLRSDVLGRVILFIGYSFRDYNVSYLFRLVAEQFGDFPSLPTTPRAYITLADPSRFERDLFQKRKIAIIPISGASMTNDVADLLQQLRS